MGIGNIELDAAQKAAADNIVDQASKALPDSAPSITPPATTEAAPAWAPGQGFAGKSAPQVDLSKTSVAPGSFAYHLMKTMASPAFAGLSNKFGPIGAFALTAPAVIADAHQNPNPLAGNVTWDAAQQDDSTTPINPNRIPVRAGGAVSRGISNVASDIAAGAPTPGQAPIFSAFKVLAAQGARQKQEQQDKITNAMTNLQMIREQQLIHKSGEESIQKAAEMGDKQFHVMLAAPGAKLAFQGKTSDEVHKLMQEKGPDGKPVLDPSENQIFQTGRVQVGTDKTGTPIYRSTYSALKPGGDITMGVAEGKEGTKADTQAARQQEEVRVAMNRYNPGEQIEKGQVLPSAVWGAKFQQMNNIAASYGVIAASNKEEGEKKHAMKLEETDAKILSNPEVMKALGQSKQSLDDPFGPVKAYFALRQHALTDPELRTELGGDDWDEQLKYTFGEHDTAKFQSKVDDYYKYQIKELDKEGTFGGMTTKEMIEHPALAAANAKAALGYDSKLDEATNNARMNGAIDTAMKVMNDTKIPEGDPRKIEAEKVMRAQQVLKISQLSESEEVSQKTKIAASEATAKEEAAKNAAKTENVVPLTSEIQNQITQLPTERQAILKQYDSNTQAALMSVAFGNGEQDLNIFPARLTKGAPGISQQQAEGVIHQLNPDWSMQSYKQKQNAYKSATTGKLSQQADSLNNFIGHAAEARRINDNFARLNLKIYDIARNKLATAGYGDQAVALGTALAVVNEEFLTMIKSGFAPTADMEKAQKVLADENATVGQINAALKVMAHMATTRAHSMNNNYKRTTGDSFPNLINPENIEDAKYLGLDLTGLYTGGRIGGSGNSPLNQKTQTGTELTAKPAAKVTGYKVGDLFMQNGHQYTVKTLNPDGSIKEAD